MRGLARVCGAACLGFYRLVVRVRAKAFSLAISGAFESFGRRTVIELPVRLHGERQIALGSDVFIGAGSWLGENVVVCPGVKIGRGAVIGANAVVREDVPAHALAVGIPAHVVSRFAPVAATAS